MQNKEKLLILDLDETLIYSEESPLNYQEDFRVGDFFTYKRPYLKEFLEFCFENFKVAIWTSSTNSYATEIVKNIFQKEQSLEFFWTRERCTMSFDEELHESIWSKKLTKLRRRGYKLESMIVIDDSPEQWRDSYGNLVKVKKFLGAKGDTELILLVAYLTKLITIENIRKIDKRNWKNRISYN